MAKIQVRFKCSRCGKYENRLYFRRGTGLLSWDCSCGQENYVDTASLKEDDPVFKSKFIFYKVE